jgi:hypothetical protein
MLRFAILSLAAVGASAQVAASICAALNPYIPSTSVAGCSCTDASQAATITCQVAIPDTTFNFGARIVLDICGTPDFALYFNYGQGYQLFQQFGLDEDSKYPIPDLSYNIPVVGTVGLEAEIDVSGSLSGLTATIGIGVCLPGLFGLPPTCDSNIPVIGGNLPVNLISLSNIDLAPLVAPLCGGVAAA